jgi:hypothetical protein
MNVGAALATMCRSLPIHRSCHFVHFCSLVANDFRGLASVQFPPQNTPDFAQPDGPFCGYAHYATTIITTLKQA